MSIRESARGTVAAPASAVFEFLTDVWSLPDWNRAITEIVEAPRQLEVGSEWKVQLHVVGQSWVSRSRVCELDPDALRFAYRSQSDDGNPSYADWVWEVEPDGDQSKVCVSVALNPTTFWRKHLLVKVRRPVLRRELQDSLCELKRLEDAQQLEAGPRPDAFTATFPNR